MWFLLVFSLAMPPAESPNRTVAHIPVVSVPESTTAGEAYFSLVMERTRSKPGGGWNFTWFMENTSVDGVWVPVRRSCACPRLSYYGLYVRAPHGWELLAPYADSLSQERSWMFVRPGGRWTIMGTTIKQETPPWKEVVVRFVFQLEDEYEIQCIRWAADSQ